MNARRLAAILCAGGVAGCGGSAGTLPPPPAISPNGAAESAAAAQQATRGASGRVQLRISIPTEESARARFVSPSTRGLTVEFKGAGASSKDEFALKAGSRGCSAQKTALVCTFVVTLPAGTYRARVATYDAPPVHRRIPPGANELASDPSIPVTVSAAKERAMKFVLDGIPSIVEIVPPAGAAGAAFPVPQPIGLDVRDADGNTILGKYAVPVDMADGDASGATTLATQGSDGPPALTLKSSSDFATLSYSGLAIEPAQIAATVRGSSHLSSAYFRPVLAPIVVTTADRQNPNFAGVDLTAWGGTGNGNGTSGTMTVSEAGWSNPPYDKTFVGTAASGCAKFAAMSPAHGTVFTARSVIYPAAGQCAVTFSDGLGQTKTATLAYSYYNANNGAQVVVVPPGVTSITFVLYGAAGGRVGPAQGGAGGGVYATVPVAPGETLYAFVGSAGSTGGAAGWNGGGAGTSTSGSGGDATDVRAGSVSLSSRLLIAGGGGGAGVCGPGANGAGGGGTTGANATGSLGGAGGSQSAGGAAGSFGGLSGGLGYGGAGGGCGGGGGGGGYFGGGGGGGTAIGPDAGGGGGGSSYVTAIATNVTNTQGGAAQGSEAGWVVMTW